MKLQIEGQRLRVRIDEDELARLLGGEPLVSRSRFAGAFALACTVRLEDAGPAVFSGSPDAWRIVLPAAEVRAYAGRLPTRDGLAFTQAGTDADDALALSFDVDVRDSVRRRHPRPGRT